MEFVFEVVEPGGTAPLPDGARGELVITSSGAPRHCPSYALPHGGPPRAPHGALRLCGRFLARIRGGVLGRAHDMLTVRGVSLYPAAIDDLVRAVPEILEYEVQIRTRAGTDDLLLKIETPEDTPFEDVDRTLAACFRSRFGIRLAIEKAPPQSLPRYELKARRYRRIPG